MSESENIVKYELKYGLNPHQKPSYFEYPKDSLIIVNGTLGYINVLDFIHGWLMAREIEDATNHICFLLLCHKLNYSCEGCGDIPHLLCITPLDVLYNRCSFYS